MSPEVLATLANYLTILPRETTINANTASAEVLSAGIPGLDLAQARAVVDQRDEGQWFNSRADFFNRLGNPDITPGNQIGVTSEWFQVTGQVTLDQTATVMQALLHRQSGQIPTVRWIKD